jgi:DNA (cytosine-5)-methyltransferase 1
LVFQEVQTDLENQGYEVQAYILPACGKNAPHKRERTWFVAHSISIGRNKIDRLTNRESNVIDKISEARNVTNTNNKGCEWNREQSITKGEISFSRRFGGWDNFPTKPALCRRDDGISRELDNITFSKWRKESIKAYGNAIVPQVAYEIFKAIQSFEDMVK